MEIQRIHKRTMIILYIVIAVLVAKVLYQYKIIKDQDKQIEQYKDIVFPELSDSTFYKSKILEEYSNENK